MSKYNGTFTITLQGEEYTLRPSFEAMIEFEERTGRATNECFLEMVEGKMSFKTIASAIWAGIKGEALWRNDPGYEKKFGVVGEMIKKDGLHNHVKNAQEFFTMAIIPESEQIKASEEEASATSKKNM